MLGVTLPPQISAELEAALQQEKVYIAKRGNRIRLAPHVYNDTAEVDRAYRGAAPLLEIGSSGRSSAAKNFGKDLGTIFCFNKPITTSSWSAPPMTIQQQICLDFWSYQNYPKQHSLIIDLKANIAESGVTRIRDKSK